MAWQPFQKDFWTEARNVTYSVCTSSHNKDLGYVVLKWSVKNMTKYGVLYVVSRPQISTKYRQIRVLSWARVKTQILKACNLSRILDKTQKAWLELEKRRGTRWGSRHLIKTCVNFIITWLRYEYNCEKRERVTYFVLFLCDLKVLIFDVKENSEDKNFRKLFWEKIK